ncbi:transposase IS3509a [Corynebacterium terpenotabidum Y-11]|uniref:Transposase IS3509a n=2 Tax=Corynebacterium terpenotabidum TaxID=89154 RepID=S4XDA8_9CORY|nr:transposase IS3509a [Corynebacterium terpenotabidum Y-11]AGP30196.1 transposase IS3509a [Corynebacterium terpenotabidum Y-11]AGP30499.1 transposase IS3509a [Corynebacterium terpenotabidum Y-11]AGP30758.1 transposase IS3509a [Corynebacterium terpenotabidum Y-11]AGP31632.1 transposase IS3509a [Corynebacterium terpenotabidum Y-11]
MKKNGTTSKGTTRWRCTTCNASSTRTTQTTAVQAATFRTFINWATSTHSLDNAASAQHVTARTLQRRFTWCWYITVPHTPDPHRIHDQIFIDGTYLAGGCLLIAATTTHVIDWHWCRRENTTAYTSLLTGIAAPLLITTDGGQGAQSAIRNLWPATNVQRCLVHVQRTVRRHTTSRPRTPAGKTLYRLALKLTRIPDLDAAADWVARLHEFSTVYADYLNEKTTAEPATTPGQRNWTWTHARVRKAHNSLLTVYRRGHLFNYLTVAQDPTTSDDASSPALKPTTNTLEGGINAMIKNLARAHRGLTAEHQRTVIDWWLHLHTQIPDDPVKIAGDQRWGQTALAKAQDLLAAEEPGPSEDGRPAIYDTAIDSTYQHSMGVQKGWVGR